MNGPGDEATSLLILILSEAQCLMASMTSESIVDLGDKVVAHNHGKFSSISVSIARSGLFQFQ